MIESIQDQIDELKLANKNLGEIMEDILTRVISIEMHCKDVPEREDENET